MGSRKTDAIDIAISFVQSASTDGYAGERAKADIVSVLEEAARYFREQEKPRTPTIADNYPAEYRELLCSECCIREEIKSELSEEKEKRIAELEERASNLYEALKLSINDEDMCACKYCGEVISWNGGHADKGCIWSCEVCGDTFCAMCAKERDQYYDDRDDVTCPDCLKREATQCPK